MGVIYGDLRFRRGLEENLPSLEEGQPGFTKDTKRAFIGSDEGNIEIAKKEDLGDLTILPSWLQESVTFAVKKMYDSMTEINVKTPPYNLKGDGTDETTTLQTLFDLASTNGSVYLYFPEGTYGMSSYIRLYKNTFVRMHDRAVIKRLGTSQKVFVNGELSNPSYVSGGYNGEGNIHFTGGTIDLNYSTLGTAQTLSAFDLGHAENISFIGVTVENGQIGHYFQLSSVKNVLIRDCWLGNVTYTDTTSAAYEVIQIEEATASSFPSFGAYDLTPSRDIYIEHCTFENVIRAIGTHSIGYNVPCENIQIRNNVIKNAADNAISLWQYKGVVVENNLIDGCQYGINMNTLQDSIIKGTTILNAQKSGLYLSNVTGTKFSKNSLKEVALSATTSYAAVRLITSSNNTFDDDTVTAVTPNYTYAWFSSDGCTGNKIISHQFAKGKTATIGGADSTEMTNYQVGPGQDVLFDGDLSTAAAVGTLSHDIRNYSMLVIMGNDNSSTTAQLISMVLPKLALLIGTTSRFRLICDDSNASDRIDFSFPTGTQIQVDAVLGSCHIRKVIGIV
jgi:hypothetical protein